MLNTRYLIINPSAEAYPNKSALGAAWFVHDYKLVANPDSEITALGKNDPALTAIIDKEFESALTGFKPVFDSTGSITLKSYAPNHLVYESNATTDQLAVFSEIYYKNGWNAYIDDKPATYTRANFVLRAMKVPGGKHKIDFKFEPTAYKTGETVALFGSILLFLAIGGALYAEFKRKKAEAPKQEVKNV